MTTPHTSQFSLKARLAAAMVASVFAVLSVAPPAALASRAPPGVEGEVFVILASEDAGSIDSSLNGMTALQRAPFNAFRSMEVIGRENVRLRPERDQDISLPNGRTLRVTLQRIMPDGRYRVRVSINRPGADAYLPLLQVMASPGDPFFVAGQAHDGGTLVIGIRLGG